MTSKLFWLVILSFAFATGVLAWLTNEAQAESVLAPKTTRSVSPPPTGSDSGNCSGTPCATIGYAISQSSNGDRINVASGWYTEHITMADGVSIHGQGWGTGGGTVITGNFSANIPTVYIPSVGPSTVLSGVQVSGGGTGDPDTSPNGSGIRILSGSPTIINTWANGNTAQSGGGVYVSGGGPSFTNVPAWNNHADYGGGYYLIDGAIVTITSDFAGTNGTVAFNSATQFGGGFYVASVTATLSGVRALTNTALSGAGAYIYSNNQVRVVSSEFSLNTATGTGGGVYAYNSSKFQILDSYMRWNAALNGAGIAAVQSSGTLKGNRISWNTAPGTWGSAPGAYVSGIPTLLTIEKNWFEGNTCGQMGEGGGLKALSGVTLTVNANAFVSNTASSGSGIYVLGASAFTATNNIIARNVITWSMINTAGGIHITNTQLARIVNNTISSNDNDGIRIEGSPGILVANNIINGNSGSGIGRTGGDSYSSDYNDVWNNDLNYSNVATGTHDMNVNPLFVGSGDMFKYYHLQATSPVSRKGFLNVAPPMDFEDDPRVVCTSMGADQNCNTILALPLIVR